MTKTSVGGRIDRAIVDAGMSQRSVSSLTGISQPTLSRVIAGTRAAKTNELLALARATGCTVAELSGGSTVAGRVQCAARSTNGAGMEEMRARLLHFLELDAYLEDQGIPAVL
ncbi:helix-turn-helix domain-containing protein [Rhodococcoides fascians]|uniref:helix-turn-helix domain-containing protein n=1 Tax=Rhodococcoides fascians TaxID=1828 RepID=UPI0009B8D5E3|nr:helix-turn-helix transcriptional regulator [Rhodococcus fascians]